MQENSSLELAATLARAASASQVVANVNGKEEEAECGCLALLPGGSSFIKAAAASRRLARLASRLIKERRSVCELLISCVCV